MKIDVALAVALAILQEANKLIELVRKSRAEGRDTLSDDELDQVVGRDDDARARLQARIDALKASNGT